jgi:S1-C subfamily serine protease
MGEFLSDLSQALAGIVASAGESVVRIEARRRLPASGFVWSSEGVIVTAHHAVQQEESIKVGLPGAQTVPASLVGRDSTTDVAVLRVEAKGLKPVTATSLDDLRVGHLVLALGRPGRTVQATMGIVSALGEAWRTPAGGQVDRYLHTDVVMYPGFSGGPLIGVKGQVLGLNTSALLRGISLTVPALTVQQVVQTLLAHGRMRRGYLGVGTQPVHLPAMLAQHLAQETGLMIMSVSPGSPADKAGLLLGDTIVALDGHPVRNMDDLLALLSGDKVGAEVPVRLVRGGQAQELAVVIGERA